MVWKRQRRRGDPRGGADAAVAAIDPVPGEGADAVPAGSTPRSGTVPPTSMVPGGLQAIPTERPGRTVERPAADLVGTGPDGRTLEVAVDAGGPRAGRLLVAFLSTDCLGCEVFWDGFRSVEALGLPDDVSLVAVARGRGPTGPEQVVRRSAGVTRVPVMVSDRAWTDYGVHGYPQFVVVDRSTATVVGESVAMGWDDVRALLGVR